MRPFIATNLLKHILLLLSDISDLFRDFTLTIYNVNLRRYSFQFRFRLRIH